MVQTQNTIVRFRDREKAHQIARELASHTRRCIGIRAFDSRTYELYAQAVLPQRTLNVMARLAHAFADTSSQKGPVDHG
jgi:hypothetical protein